LDRKNKLSTLFHGTAAQSFHSLVHALGFNMVTYPYYYYDSSERVLKPWIRDLSEGAGDGLLFDYVEKHEKGILPEVAANEQHEAELNNNDSVDGVALGEATIDNESVGSTVDDETMRDVIIESDPVLPAVVVVENNVPLLSALAVEENENEEVDTSC